MSLRKQRALPFRSVITSLALCLAASSGSAQWKLDDVTYVPFSDSDGQTCTTIFGSVLGWSSASTASNGAYAAAVGQAFDVSLNCDVTAQVGGTGRYSESWVWKGKKGEGWCKIKADLVTDGVVNLVNADCAAAALGFGEFSSNITPTVVAVLNKSAGETGSNQLGSVSAAYGGLQGSYNVTVGTGEGSYPDNDTNGTNAQGCHDFFTRQHRARGFMKVWANAGLDISAECNGQMTATVKSVLILGTCPKDPPGGGDEPGSSGGGTTGGSGSGGTTGGAGGGDGEPGDKGDEGDEGDK